MATAKAGHSFLSPFLRFSRILGGSATLAIAAAYPLSHTETPVTPIFTICCLIPMSMVAARYVDIRACDGQTVDSDLADLGHSKRYALILLPVSVLLPVGVWAMNALIGDAKSPRVNNHKIMKGGKP